MDIPDSDVNVFNWLEILSGVFWIMMLMLEGFRGRVA